ncbi:hypothetical protein DMUE_5300 [Dictyocoela muelleri]|nr:hypothetical protein DMUE_5300 [Dictyocoela muelleri]
MNSESRYVIFFSSIFLSYIKNLKTLIIDETFKSSPQQFYQLLVIQGYLFGRFLPLIFILFQEKSEDIYKKAFLYLKDNEILNPTTVITDYEKALLTASKIFNNNVKSFGCLFHYGQCIWRKIQHHALSTLYKTNKDVKSILKKFLNFPFFNPREYKNIQLYCRLHSFISK